MYSPNKTVAIPNGVKLAEFAPSTDGRAMIRSQLGIDPSAVVLVCCARLSPSKGVDVLLEAMYWLMRSGKRCECIVVGDGPLRERLQEQAIHLGVRPHVHFEGFKEDVRPYLHSADVFVLTSYQEGMPIAVLESMACGLPCVVTDVGGTAEAVSHMKEGLLVKPGSAQDVAEALAYLLEHADERNRMARQAFTKSREFFDVDARMREIRSTLLS
jgi:glycosyltransferase involved in cell wall biosynthesis